MPETERMRVVRPLAPSEKPRDRAQMGRRILGSAAAGGASGAALSHYLGKKGPLLAATGAGIGALHGALRSRESTMRDRTTQERMAIRESLREQKKKRAAMEIDAITLRAMADELVEIRKEAGLGSMVGGLGSKIMTHAGSGLSNLAARGGRIGALGTRLDKAVGQGALKAVNRFGQGAVEKAVGGAALGAGALGVGALGYGAKKALTPKRPEPSGY